MCIQELLLTFNGFYIMVTLCVYLEYIKVFRKIYIKYIVTILQIYPNYLIIHPNYIYYK